MCNTNNLPVLPTNKHTDDWEKKNPNKDCSCKTALRHMTNICGLTSNPISFRGLGRPKQEEKDHCRPHMTIIEGPSDNKASA